MDNKRTESVWKTRWGLFLRSARTNWNLFKERKVAIFGLVVIILFGVFGALYPSYTSFMGDKYTSQLETMAKQIYLAYERNLQDIFLKSNSDIDYTLKVQNVSDKLGKDIDLIFKRRRMNTENTFRDAVQDTVEKYFDYNSRKSMFDYIESSLKNSKSVEEAAKKIAEYFYMKKIEDFINDTGTYEKSQIVWSFLKRDVVKKNILSWAKRDPKSFVNFLRSYQIYCKPSDLKKNFDEIMKILMAKADLDVFPLLSSPDALENAVDMEKLRKALSDVNVLYYISLAYDLGMSREDVVKSKSDLINMFVESPDFDTYSQAILQKKVA